MKLLIINGPNLNMLGIREKHLYGAQDFKALCNFILETAQELGVEAELYQSNHEGVLIDKLHEAWDLYDGVVFNPGAYCHTSIALADAIRSIETPVVEVHTTVNSAPDITTTYDGNYEVKFASLNPILKLAFLHP